MDVEHPLVWALEAFPGTTPRPELRAPGPATELVDALWTVFDDFLESHQNFTTGDAEIALLFVAAQHIAVGDVEDTLTPSELRRRYDRSAQRLVWLCEALDVERGRQPKGGEDAR